MRFDYPTESFSAEERRLLEPFFTNLDRPVFGLRNLPETVKGALFARYSRYPGTLRRLFLEEFVDGLDVAAAARLPLDEGERARRLYERVFLGYGDDSVAQLGGAHIACEWVSNALTKVLERGRLAAYLEQSTRYIPYDQPRPDGRFRYWRCPQLGESYVRAMDRLFELYGEALRRAEHWVAERFPRRSDEHERAWHRAVRAKALDLVRGLLPVASLSHVGIFASGQAYEQLLLRLFSNPLPEAQQIGELLLAELECLIPSFVARVRRADRGGVWIDYLRRRREQARKAAERLGIAAGQELDEGPYVRLMNARGSEEEALAALLFEVCELPEQEIRAVLRGLGESDRAALWDELVGERLNRRHRPGRGLEALSYRFEIVSDYGAFRDLQRHRLLTCQWQALSPALGAEVPPEAAAAGISDLFEEAFALSRAEYERVAAEVAPELAPYALCLAFRIRYVLDLNAREAMHLIELRSGREGHPSYRAVALAMLDEIARVHPHVARAMKHVDRSSEPRLERLLAEMRSARNFPRGELLEGASTPVERR